MLLVTEWAVICIYYWARSKQYHVYGLWNWSGKKDIVPDGEIHYNKGRCTAFCIFFPGMPFGAGLCCLENMRGLRKGESSMSNEQTFLMKPKVDFCFKELMEDTIRRMYSDKLEIHILELPKLAERQYPQTELLKWASFFQAEKKEEFEMAAEGSSYIERAYERLTEISADDLKRLEYESREKAIRDHIYLMNYNLKKGLEEGKEEGRKEGREEGLEEGLTKGRQEGIEQGMKVLIKF